MVVVKEEGARRVGLICSIRSEGEAELSTEYIAQLYNCVTD